MMGEPTMRAHAAQLLMSTMLALAATTTPVTPALAKTGGDTVLYVEQSTREDATGQEPDGQQRTTTSSKGPLAQTGDPGARGVAALALVGGSLTAIGSAAKRRRSRLVPVSSDAADASAAHLS